MITQPRMKLALLLHGTGFHVAGWLHPSVPLQRAADLSFFAELARIAEQAKFDMIFLADAAAVAYTANPAAQRRIALAQHLEPLTLLSALAGLTDRIGLVGSMTTSFLPPYLIARQFASLDQLCQGRAGWNVVTSANPNEALNYGAMQQMSHAERYTRAREVLSIVLGLWDSWDSDAFPLDRENAIYLDPGKMRILNYHSDLFHAQGPLNVQRSPQERPIICQAGSSGPGIDLGAATADCIFTAQQTFHDGRAFSAKLKSRAAEFGRSSSDLVVLTGVVPIVGSTIREAQEKFDFLQSLVRPEVGLQLLYDLTGGLDLSGYPVDGPVPELVQSDAIKSRLDLLKKLAEGEALTIRQLYLRAAGGRGHRTVIGTPTSIADDFQNWFEGGCTDGFAIMPAYFPEGLRDFADHVVPELQRRGLFRTDYEGATLRENLGLSVPNSTRVQKSAWTESVAC